MRDGRSKTAPIINHRMIHSIVPSPSVRSSSKPDPGEKARAFSKEITSAAGRELASSLRRRQSITLGTRPVLRDSPYPRVLSIFLSLSLAPHLPRRKPSHTSTYTPEPATAFILVRSFFLFTTLPQIAPISRAVNFIFPRHFSLDVVPRRFASTPRRALPWFIDI